MVASEDNTVVTIMPSQDLVGHPAGIPFKLFCRHDLFRPRSGNAKGTPLAHIAADKPVAVTCMTTRQRIGGCYDLMGDQLVPDDLLGTDTLSVSGFLLHDVFKFSPQKTTPPSRWTVVATCKKANP